jgi:hypothetical protein
MTKHGRATIAALPQTLLIVALAAQPAISGAIAGCFSLRWAAAGAAAIVCGVMLMRWTCGRIPAAAFLMLAACAAGMAAGGAMDSLSPPLGGLAALCTSASMGFAAVAFRHAAALPAMHGLMLLGGAGAMVFIESQARHGPAKSQRHRWARLGFGAVCNAAMLAGMAAGGWIGLLLSAPFELDAMLAMMGTGMVWGMAAMTMICRAGSAVLIVVRESTFFNRAAGAPDLARP